MAKCHIVNESIVFLLVIFGISTTLSTKNSDRYFIDELPDHSLVFRLLGRFGEHEIEKRSVSTTSSLENATSTTNSSLLPTQAPKKAISQSIGNVTIPKLPERNLGENGTGIRKDVFTTKMPPILQDGNATTLLTNKTTSVNKSVNTSNVDYHDFIIPSDIDTPDGKKKFNESLTEQNITSMKTDPNLFYNTSINNNPSIGHFYWVNLTNRLDVKINDLLSQSHRRAATVKLSFDFPFYGHLIQNVTIATGGFLYTGDYVHSWLAATQYIAPLMANFDTSLSNDSFIKYVDNGTAFTVQWENVMLQDKPKDGKFTFQVTLFKTGDIVFVYQSIPVLVDQIQELHHPVKIGLSDAYIMDHLVVTLRRKTIYEYDRVNFNKTFIKDWSTIILKALPTCLDATDCNSCLSRDLKFQCLWCPALNKCSQGFDRHRQTWLAHGCDKSNFSNASMCSASSYHIEDESNMLDHSMVGDHVSIGRRSDHKGRVNATDMKEAGNFSGLLAILFLVGMMCGLSLWVFYAYRNPHTTSGQILIRYRPSQWRWRRGEARYTAATIHM